MVGGGKSFFTLSRNLTRRFAPTLGFPGPVLHSRISRCRRTEGSSGDVQQPNRAEIVAGGQRAFAFAAVGLSLRRLG